MSVISSWSLFSEGIRSEYLVTTNNFEQVGETCKIYWCSFSLTWGQRFLKQQL